MAFMMVQTIQKIRKAINFEGLNMRIGLHIGDIIGGVIGTEIVRYDIYGKNVVIANKMESNSTAGNIRISEKYKRLLSKNFHFNYEFSDMKVFECKTIDMNVRSWIVNRRDHY